MLISIFNFQAVERWARGDSVASAIIMGSATHSIKDSNNSAEALFQYTRNLTVLRPVS